MIMATFGPHLAIPGHDHEAGPQQAWGRPAAGLKHAGSADRL